MNYIEILAQKIKEEVPEDKIPHSGNLELLFEMYAVLLLAKGVSVSSDDVHNAWAAWMSQEDPNHLAIKPFNDLPHEIQKEDEPFAEAIRKVASTLN